MPQKTSYEIADPLDKLAQFRRDCAEALHSPELLKSLFTQSLTPSRSGEVLHSSLHPKKKGLSFRDGQARLLHDLASIELQAMELALRTLIEFPEADPQFREELYHLALNESEHFELCLQGLNDYGYRLGSWPVHLGLWHAVSNTDSLLDRILIVHRYLEGAGLDSGVTLQRRLDGLETSPLHKISKKILTEEIGHVYFGSHWYRHFCKIDNLDPDQDFTERFQGLIKNLPQRIEPVAQELRTKAGFSQQELKVLTEHRESILIAKGSPPS